jgi:hypothetical protein
LERWRLANVWHSEYFCIISIFAAMQMLHFEKNWSNSKFFWFYSQLNSPQFSKFASCVGWS